MCAADVVSDGGPTRSLPSRISMHWARGSLARAQITFGSVMVNLKAWPGDPARTIVTVGVTVRVHANFTGPPGPGRRHRVEDDE